MPTSSPSSSPYLNFISLYLIILHSHSLSSHSTSLYFLLPPFSLHPPSLHPFPLHPPSLHPPLLPPLLPSSPPSFLPSFLPPLLPSSFFLPSSLLPLFTLLPSTYSLLSPSSPSPLHPPPLLHSSLPHTPHALHLPEVTLTIQRKFESGQFGMVRVDYRTLRRREIAKQLPFTSDASFSLAQQGRRLHRSFLNFYTNATMLPRGRFPRLQRKRPLHVRRLDCKFHGERN